MNTQFKFLMAASLLALSVGCAADDDNTEPTPAGAVDDPVLVSVDALQADWPGNDTLPREDKSDQNFPSKFSEPVETQSRVKSQGSRGVCSIFSTAAYMEHLYIAEGTITDPDFSEQYLQWSAKFEVGSFPNTSGSNAGSNLDAISDFGIPEESAWPYETSEWNSSDDEECTGEDDQPTRCYTNGDPPQSARDAEKFFLPSGRWHSTRERSIKSTMFNKKQGVVVGLTFFYQSWNHRRSQLPRNLDYWNEGYVLAPNAEDRRISLEKRAGHSILLVGWDDTLEVQKMDEEGKGVVDSNGDPVMEKGFFIFKNSWGTGSFGKNNVHGDGYGYISYDYVEEHGSGRVSDLPEFEAKVEICGDGDDNDGNGAADCDDAACSAEPACQSTGGTETIEVELTETAIPDNDAAGLTLPFELGAGGAVRSMSVSVDITHSFRGDLTINLIAPSGESETLRASEFSSEADLKETYVVESLLGEGEGTWSVQIVDNARIDEGTVNNITVEVTR